MAVDPFQLPQEQAAGALARASTSNDLVAIAGAPKEAETYSPDENALVSGQLARILSQDNPLVSRARTRAAQYSNSRGLLDSSMAAGAGEAAAIDAALPIAQGDATAYFTAQRDNTTARNQFGLDENRFRREGALAIMGERFRSDEANAGRAFTGGQAALDRAAREQEFSRDLGLRGEDLALRREQTQLEDARMERELGLREGSLALDRERQAEQTRQQDAGLLADLQRTYMDARLQLETNPNLDADGKARAINAMSDWFMQSVLSPMRATLADPSLWPDFAAPSRYVPPSGGAAPDGAAAPTWMAPDGTGPWANEAAWRSYLGNRP